MMGTVIKKEASTFGNGDNLGMHAGKTQLKFYWEKYCGYDCSTEVQGVKSQTHPPGQNENPKKNALPYGHAVVD